MNSTEPDVSVPNWFAISGAAFAGLLIAGVAMSFPGFPGWIGRNTLSMSILAVVACWSAKSIVPWRKLLLISWVGGMLMTVLVVRTAGRSLGLSAAELWSSVLIWGVIVGGPIAFCMSFAGYGILLRRTLRRLRDLEVVQSG